MMIALFASDPDVVVATALLQSELNCHSVNIASIRSHMLNQGGKMMIRAAYSSYYLFGKGLW